MAKEILLYDYIYSYSASNFITQLEAAKSDDVTVRINTNGGSVQYTFGMVAKYLELPNRNIKVDGAANSGGAFFCCYAPKEEVECLDISTFLFHRAAYPDYIESNSQYFTESMRQGLIDDNVKLRAAMESKMTSDAFEKETGVSFDSLFSLDTRIDVILSADQAKRLGLVGKVTPITPQKKAEVQALVFQVAAMRTGIPATIEAPITPTPKILKPNTMNIQELKAAHPEAYAAAVNEGVIAERDRVGSFLAFIDVDAEAAVKGIKEGKELTATATAEFSMKAINKLAGAKAEGENAKDITTEEAEKPEAAKTEAAKKLEAFNAEVDAKLGLGKK